MAYDYITAYEAYAADLETINDARDVAAAKRTAIRSTIEAEALAHLTLESGDYVMNLESNTITIYPDEDAEFDVSQLTAFEAAFENAALTVSSGAIILELTESP